MSKPREMIGASPALRRAIERATSAARTDVPVLIAGESGTGKEVLARMIHARSARAQGPFIAVNATAMPFHLLESELFGHERGAFTGADRPRIGLFQAAHRGTLLIDEIGDLPLALQTKMLRVLQEGEVRPVGRNHAIPVDVRAISATHHDLPARVASGEFRRDLYYRVSVFTVEVPALRERPEDVIPLAEHFIRMHARGHAPNWSDAAASLLQRHVWPGNVRELENACRHALVLCGRGDILPEHLPVAVIDGRGHARPSLSIWEARSEAEKDRIYRALSAVAGNRTQAARRLGMSRQALHDRLRKYGIASGAGRPVVVGDLAAWDDGGAE